MCIRDRASIVKSLRVSEILPLGPLLCSSTPLFPTPPLVSPKFPHVPQTVGGWPLDYEERIGVGLIRVISFQDFQHMWSWSTNITDGRTDGRTDMQLQYRALHYSASRGKNPTTYTCSMHYYQSFRRLITGSKKHFRTFQCYDSATADCSLAQQKIFSGKTKPFHPLLSSFIKRTWYGIMVWYLPTPLLC